MKSRIVIIAILLFSSFSCFNSNNTSEKNNNTFVKKWIGKKIIIPSDTLSIKIINSSIFDYSNFFKSDNIKLIVSINGESVTCEYKLKTVEAFADQLLSSYENISLLVYVNSMTTDFFDFKIKNDNEIKFKYPLLYDNENKYLKKNKFSSNDLYSILLCDKDDKILMIGDFTKNKALKDLYLNQIKSHASPLIYDSPITPVITKTPIKIP